MNKLLSEKLNAVALQVPDILFPREGIDLTKFSCIAADQYTQDLAYWDRVRKFIGDAPSTYNLIYPEAEYIRDIHVGAVSLASPLAETHVGGKQSTGLFSTASPLSVGASYASPNEIVATKIKNINNCMNKYITDGTYENIGKAFIFVERKSPSQNRRGLLVAIDLEKYDYNEGAKTLIRATEKTVKDRLTLRKEIRENATLDLPHILVLINDKEDKLFKKVESIKFETFFRMSGESKNDILYDFDLMENSGYIKGYKIADDKDIESIADILIELKDKSEDGFLYAIGDGNHSLAAAKDIYEKTGRGRYALVELVNIYDDGIRFFPIHRLIMGVEGDKFIADTGIDPDNPPPLQELQTRLDKFNYNIDYIHGKKECIELGKKPGNIAITYDGFSIETLFSDVVKYGSLCRKSFSLGEAKDKRFYLEAQEII